MLKEDLNSKWKSIRSSMETKTYTALRISDNCLPDLFLAIDPDGYSCLLLSQPKDLQVDIKENDRIKLSISHIPEKGYVLIKLKDPEFQDLFDDFILSMYNCIHLIAEPEAACNEFITTFNRWSLFFEKFKGNKLSEEQIQGLFGELYILLKYLNEDSVSEVNNILGSWKGLYDLSNDFEFDSKNVEVKTKKESNIYVKISSEYQLEKIPNKDLELIVVSVKIELSEGRSLHDMIVEISDIIDKKHGDLYLLHHALSQKKLTIENLAEYNNYKYIITKTESFDAGHENFPRLNVSNINSEISSLKYKLRVTDLDEYLIKESDK
jgi:hypothetical protein